MDLNWEDKRWVAGALLAMYNRQELDEQAVQATTKRNDVGFNSTDAFFCSDVARKILAGQPFTEGRFLMTQKILKKYHGQISSMHSFPAVPETAFAEYKKKEQGQKVTGWLKLDEHKHLVFTPNIYPSKQIQPLGFKWNKPDWVSNRFSIGLVRQVIEMFGNVKVDQSVTDLVAQLTEKAKLPAEIENHSTLFTFQKEAIQFLNSTDRAMLALAPGLGKTASAVFAADLRSVTGVAETVKSFHRILIVAPLSLVVNWKREIARWVDQIADIWHGDPKTWMVHSRDFKWVITNYETLARHLETFERIHWDVLIADESVLVKNRKAKRTKAIKELAQKIKVVWELSGAPTTRFYSDMWAQLNILDHSRFSSFWRFAGRYCEIMQSQWGASIIGNKVGAAAMMQKDLVDCYFCRTQDQVLDLPEWIFTDQYIRMGEDQWDLYRGMEEDLVAELSDEPDDKILAGNILVQILRLIQLASNPVLLGGKDCGAKWKAVYEILEYEELPAIIWTNFVQTAQILETMLTGMKYSVGVLTGETSKTDLQKIVDQFQAGELDIIIAHPGVGKFGLTLTRARTVIYLERSYNGDDYYQSLHRVRRIGTTHSPHVIHLMAVGPKDEPTIDAVIHKVLSYRKDQNLKLTAGELRNILENNNGKV